MALRDTMKQAAEAAAYAAGYGYGKVSKVLQEAEGNPATQKAAESVREAALKTADAAEIVAQRMKPAFWELAGIASDALQDVAAKLAAVAREAATQVEPAVHEGVARAQEAVAKASDAARDAATRAAHPGAVADGQAEPSGWTYPNTSA